MSDQTNSTDTAAADGPVWPGMFVTARWIGPLLIAIVAAIMVRWTWMTWPDVLIDFGRDLYVAWQLAEGKTLYKDVAYFYGCLSPHINALWFKLFGVSILTLAICNMAIAAALVGMLYHILSQIADRLSATIACLVFVTLFAAIQVDVIGNYNYICPYSHEMTHGITLSILAIYLLLIYQRRRYVAAMAGAGLVLGFVFLTKPEIFVAAALAMVVGFGLTIWIEHPPSARRNRMLAAFFVALVAPPIAACCLLSLAMPFKQAAVATTAPWVAMVTSDVASLDYIRAGMGTLDVKASLMQILTWLGWYAAIFGSAAAVAMALRKQGNDRFVIAMIVWAVVVAFVQRQSPIDLTSALKPTPLFLIAMNLVFLARIIHHRREHQICDRMILRLTIGIFAFLLLGKIMLNTRLFHYGFALAMPATMLLVVAMVSWAPALIHRTGGYGGVFKAAAYAAIVATIYAILTLAHIRIDTKAHVVASGANAIRADFRGPYVNEAVDQIKRRLQPGQTIVALPDAAMINYLSKRPSSTPYFHFSTGELAAYSEDRIVKALKDSPPDLVALVHKFVGDTGFSYGMFGRDYGQLIWAWIEQHYTDVHLIGKPPMQMPEDFGIRLLKRIKPKNEATKVDEALCMIVPG